MADDTRIESLAMEDSTYDISIDEIENEEHIDDLLETDEDGNLNWHGIRESITPQTLARCRTSSLEKALEVSHKLSVLAPQFSGKEGLDELATSVEDFAYKLVEPLKKKIDGIIASKEGNLEKDFDRVCDAAIDYEQKKFLSHYVMYKLLMNHWKGDFYRIYTNSGWFSRQHFMWIFYNIWNVLDVFIFPLPYLLMYVINKVSLNIGYRNKIQVDYDQYFVTPYFIFVRDFLNYLLLFGLHVAKCLQPSSLQFTTLEWAIMVFFLGRILMEIQEMFTAESFEKNAIVDCDGLLHPKSKRQQNDTARVSKSKHLKKYFGNCWNMLDVIILVNYLVFLILRVVTWSGHTSVRRNRLLAVAGYIFGFNTMVLTLRVFGHILEIFPSTGSIQVALFQIIGAAVTVLGQFIVAILAFSLAITKIYVAEDSYSAANSKGTCGNQSGLVCWWSHATHLAWSLLGDAELEPLHSSDQVSDVIAKLMYCTFLIICVVMLMNMMIALLSNTYQQVEDNAFNEWSYRKANTIRTYSTYHPVPIPFNIISISVIFLRYICNKIKAKKSKKPSKTNTCKVGRKGREMFHKLVLDLEDQYFAVYGNDFPVSADKKIDCLLNEVGGSHQLMGHISQRFLYDFQSQRSALQGVEGSDIKCESYGIGIDGHTMSYVSCSDTCSEEANNKAFHGHGARCLVPLSEQCPGFEVLINKCKEKRIIAIGIVPVDYASQEFPCSGWDFPGRYEGTVGYHINNGKIFDEDNSVRGRHGDDAMAYRGDMIGCQVLYSRQTHESLPVIFTLNGRVVGKALLKIKENTPLAPFFPFIGIGWKGISLQFRLCFKKKTSDQHLHQVPHGITEQLNYLIAKQEAVDQKLDFLIRNLRQKTFL